MNEFKPPPLKPCNIGDDVLDKIKEQFAEQIASDREYLELNLIAQGINPDSVTITCRIINDDKKGTITFKHVVISKLPGE